MELSCLDCGAAFRFEGEEAAFYAERGFSPPKRCRRCREERRARREGRPAGVAPEPDPPRFEAQCSACGAMTTLPFAPSDKRPVYCEECFEYR